MLSYVHFISVSWDRETKISSDSSSRASGTAKCVGLMSPWAFPSSELLYGWGCLGTDPNWSHDLMLKLPSSWSFFYLFISQCYPVLPLSFELWIQKNGINKLHFLRTGLRDHPQIGLKICMYRLLLIQNAMLWSFQLHRLHRFQIFGFRAEQRGQLDSALKFWGHHGVCHSCVPARTTTYGSRSTEAFKPWAARMHT